MADLSDVEQALLTGIVGAVYPNGADQASVVAAPVKIYRGWPVQLGLNADLAAGNQTVTIFSDPKHGCETTRYPRVWRQAALTPPTLTASVAGAVVTFSGAGGPGQIAGVRVDGAAFAYALGAADTPSSVSTAMAALIPGATAVGATLTIAGATSIEVRVEGLGIATMETRRQEQTVTVSVWCNEPLLRDGLASAIDNALSGVDWLPLSDGSSGLLRYRQTIETDTSENADLYRRDLLYAVEYPTIWTMTAPAMMFGVLAGVEPAVQATTMEPRIGAIRFDAWYTPTDTIDQQCAAALSPAQWSVRWPPNAVSSDGVLTWPVAEQATIDAEIEAAATAGIAFWAFDSYAPGDDLGAALSLYLSSSRRQLVGFCMLGQISNWADPTTVDGYAATLARDVGLMAEAGYVTSAEAGRPVYFVLDAPASDTALLPSGVAGAIAHVRSLASAAGLPDPYIVWLSGASLLEYDNVAAAREAGADAAGAYACPGNPSGQTPYATLAALAEADWNARSVTGFAMVPTAMTGWDPRPLIENPQPFYPVPSSDDTADFYAAGTPTEIGSHVADAADFVAGHGAACASGLALVYAWNELAEGGWIMPTYTPAAPDPGRVDAIGAAFALRARQRAAGGSIIV